MQKSELEKLERRDYDFGALTFGDRFVIGEMKRGSNIELEVVTQIIRLARARFGEQTWGYISHRVHSYSLQPSVHFEAPKFEPNMVAFAVVTSEDNRGLFVALEKQIAAERYGFGEFSSLEEAVGWVRERL